MIRQAYWPTITGVIYNPIMTIKTWSDVYLNMEWSSTAEVLVVFGEGGRSDINTGRVVSKCGHIHHHSYQLVTSLIEINSLHSPHVILPAPLHIRGGGAGGWGGGGGSPHTHFLKMLCFFNIHI